MKANYLDYSETRSFSPAIIRYLEDDPKLAQFKSFNADLDGFRDLISQKKDNVNRKVLTEVLTAQYSRLSNPTHSSVSNSIQLLSSKDTYTVTTGHQVNLFTGPLYFIFKIVSAINLAKELKANFPDKDFVPVYWMATEDHDFAEINHTYIADKKITWDAEVSGATGRIETKGVEKMLREYTSTLGISEHAEDLEKLIKNAYLKNSNLADATRALVNSLFEEYGLLILDADDPKLKAEFTAIISEDIIHQNSYKNISATSQKLEDLGIKSQVKSREINFFYLLDKLRERIVFEDNLYKVLNTDISFKEEELKLQIKQYPERFSPNVIMRPLYQELILPNLAYIGGGAEVVYWLQLKQNFDYYKVGFPILVLRNSALITTNNLVSKLSRLDLGFTDIFKDPESLRKEWIFDHTDHILDLNDDWKELSAILDRIKARAQKIDATLAPSTDAVRARLQKSISTLESKLIKAEKRNFSDALTQIDSIKDRLFPRGGLQERTENFGLFYVKHGREFIRTLITSFKPLERKFTILED